MTFDLSGATFTNDIYSMQLPDGSTLVLNKVDEEFIGNTGIYIKQINTVVVDTEGNENLVSSVIGESNDYFTLASDYEDVLGTVLTDENMSKCYIEVEE